MRQKIRNAALVACGLVAVAASAHSLSRVIREFVSPQRHGTAPSASWASATTSSNVVEQVGSAPKLVPISLQLQGDVTGVPDGTVIDGVDVAVGSEHVAATINDRSFLATTPLMRPGEMVSVTVSARGIRYRSLLGSLARLKSLSGGDQVVSASEAPTLHVGPISTALAVLERNALGSRDPSSDAEFEDTLQYFLGNDVVVTAYMLDRYARGDLQLPIGYATGYDLVSDPSRFSSELDALIYSGTTPWDPTSYVVAQPVTAPLSRMDEVPVRTLALSGHAKDPITMNAYAFWLERRDDGRIDYLDSTPSQDSRYDAALANGVLKLVPVVPTAQRRIETTSFSPSVPVAIDRTLDTIEWRRLIDGQRVDYWTVVRRWTDNYPDNPSRAPASVTTADVIASTDFAPMVQTAAWTDMAGRRQTLPIYCLDTSSLYAFSTCDTAIHRFDPGGSGMTEDVGYKVDSYMQPQPGRYGGPFQWSANTDGSLVVRYTDGSTTLWSMGSIPGVDSIVYKATRTSGNVTRTALGVAITVRATTVPFDTAKVPGTWESGMVLAAAPTYPPDHFAIVWTRNADGTGGESNTYLTDTTHFAQWWSVIGERLYERRTRARMSDGSLRWVSDCSAAQAAGATQCAPWRVRYLRPLRRVGNRLYGIEEVHLQAQLKPIGYTGAYSVTSTTRASYQQCDTGDCASYNVNGPTPQYLPPTLRTTTPAVLPRVGAWARMFDATPRRR